MFGTFCLQDIIVATFTDLGRGLPYLGVGELSTVASFVVPGGLR